MEFKVGDKFRSAARGAEQEDINRFGALHGTTGRTHTDPEYARNSVFGGVIVQGALVMAPVLNMAADLLGDAWLDGGEIEAKFVAFTRPGEAVDVAFEVTRSEPEWLELAYACTLADGKKVQVGTITRRRG